MAARMDLRSKYVYGFAVTYRVAGKHGCAPTGYEGCAGNASAACRCYGAPDNLAAADSPGTGRNDRN